MPFNAIRENKILAKISEFTIRSLKVRQFRLCFPTTLFKGLYFSKYGVVKRDRLNQVKSEVVTDNQLKGGCDWELAHANSSM